MTKEIIRTESAPRPGGPYSQAVRLGDVVYVAGQVALDPQTRTVVGSDVQTQTRQVMENLRAILEAAGSSLAQVVKTTCYLRNIDEFAVFNGVYAGYFPQDPPARTTVEASRLPGNVLLEVDAIAAVG